MYSLHCDPRLLRIWLQLPFKVLLFMLTLLFPASTPWLLPSLPSGMPFAHISMWHLLICILISAPETTEEPSLILPAEVIVLSSELREHLACSAVYFWVLFS